MLVNYYLDGFNLKLSYSPKKPIVNNTGYIYLFSRVSKDQKSARIVFESFGDSIVSGLIEKRTKIAQN